MKYFSTAAVAAVLLMLAGTDLHAQTLGMGQLREAPSNMAAYYYYARTGDVTMNVGVWGTVRYPGQYEIKDGSDLGIVLSLAGGPALTPRRRQDTRRVTISVMRMEDQRRHQIFKSELDELISAPQAYPILQHGDVVLVETVERQGFTWRDIVPFVGAAAAVAVAIERFVPR